MPGNKCHCHRDHPIDRSSAVVRNNSGSGNANSKAVPTTVPAVVKGLTLLQRGIKIKASEKSVRGQLKPWTTSGKWPRTARFSAMAQL